jgi:hypothetical protein
VEDSSIPTQEKKKEYNRNVIAWRLSPNLIPMFEELAQQAHQAHLIKKPSIISLAKFSLKFFAEMWLQQKAAQARYEQEVLQGQRSPVKDIQGNLYTGPCQVKP